MLSASQHYLVDPLGKEAALLNDEQKKRILGGEACMWAEFITPETIDSRIWPRAAAVAERLWSPENVQDIEDMYRRLEILSEKLDWLNVTHHSNYPKMLKRLTGNRSIGPLKALADIVEPVKYYTRPSTRKYTQMTPLNRLVDAARPESDKARIFRNFVDKMLADSPQYKDKQEIIKEWLEEWRSNHVKLKPILEESFLLKEIHPLSEYVSKLAQVGLDAIAYLDDRNPPPQSWLKDITPLLNPSKNPEYELVVMITPAIQKLVDFVLNKD
jgi:hexosaminidase